MGEPWTCPFCNMPSTIRDHDISVQEHKYISVKEDEHYQLETFAITCPSEDCREVTIILRKLKGTKYVKTFEGNKPTDWNRVYQRFIEPEASVKPFPDYVPDQVLQDYKEAKLIADLSPKASATLARRCLQSMIRDFYNISGKKSLHHEIEAIQSQIDTDMYDAIMALKSIGNIGAHPEKDINLIVDVEPGEAQELIGLIEMLIEDWYVARHKKQERIKEIQNINTEKQNERKGNTSTSP